MTVHTTAKKHSHKQSKKHFIPNFEVRSVLLLAALALGAAAAQAQTSPPSPANPGNASAQMTAAGTAGAIPPNRTTGQQLEAAFNRADVDRDGKLSRQETEHFPALVQRFEQIDTNRDGFISRDEFGRAAGL